ncbi:MAG: tocopherol cyclase family protein [Actinomycetota bacterium]
MSEGDNAPVWTGRPGMYEVWFLTCSDPAAGRGYWIRSTLHASREGRAHAAVWFARFDRGDPSLTFGIHRRHEMDAVTIAPDGFDVRIGETRFASGRSSGSLEGAGRTARWDLEFATGDDTYRLLPDVLYRGSLAPTKPLSPNVSTAITGMVEVDGEVAELNAVPAQQGHLYGSRHAQRWAWGHCSSFDDEDAVVQALTAQGRRGPITTPFVTSVGIRWEGRWIRLTKVSRRRDFGLGSWRIDVGNRRYRLSGRIEAPAQALLRTRYEDPDGRPRFCHNSEVSSSRLALFERKAGGFEEIALLESRGTTHAEWAGLTPAHDVPHDHVEVGT